MDWMTPEQRAWQIENTKRREAAHREFLRLFGVWRFCPKKPCRRQKACTGPQPVTCLGAFSAAMPPMVHHWVCFQIKALGAGIAPDRVYPLYREQMTARLAAERAQRSSFNEGFIAEIEDWLAQLERARARTS